MSVCFLPVASELVRMTLVNNMRYTNGVPRLTVIMVPSVSSPNRARGVPLYNPTVMVSWGPEDWAWQGVAMVDKRGYFVEWSHADVYPWLVSTLNGSRCEVQIQFQDGAAMPKKWTAKRVAAAALRLDEFDPVAVQAVAAAKLATVATWAESARKASLVLAAQRMISAAAWSDAARQLAQGGSLDPWGGGSLDDPGGGGGTGGGGGGV
jgi:hypothetical protein